LSGSFFNSSSEYPCIIIFNFFKIIFTLTQKRKEKGSVLRLSICG
jgi:hypothetical protein